MEKMKSLLKMALPYLLTVVTLTLGFVGITLWEDTDGSMFDQVLKFALGGIFMYAAFFPSFDSWLKFWKQFIS